MEAPAGGEGLEGTLDEMHVDRLAGTVVVARGEGLTQARHADGERGAGRFGASLVHACRHAPGQEGRIGLDVLDQPVHLVRAVLDDRRPGHLLHGKIGSACRSSITAKRATTTSSRSAMKPASCSTAGK